LVLQLHLMPASEPQKLEPKIGLYFDSSPPAGPSMVLMRLDADQQLEIPPGAGNFVVSDTFKLPVDVDVLAVYPHAHFIAKKIEATATLADGGERWLIRIDDWNFKWQDVYRYLNPVSLPRGTTLRMRYTYDNSLANPRNPSRPARRVTA